MRRIVFMAMLVVLALTACDTEKRRLQARIAGLERQRGSQSMVYPSVRTKDGANRLKVAKAGSRLRFFVNDALVHAAANRSMAGAGVGVEAISGDRSSQHSTIWKSSVVRAID